MKIWLFLWSSRFATRDRPSIAEGWNLESSTRALIIATFAVFEKKRAEVRRVVDGLKDWQR